MRGLFLLLAPSLAHAILPLPVQPDCGVGGDLSACPPEADDWTLWSHTPAEIESQLRPEEVPMGIGNGVLAAWRLGTGHWEDLVAVADSGIMWQRGDTRAKIFLNIEELPLPQDALGSVQPDHDTDGNGLVNILDYAEDPRVGIDAGDWRSDEVLDASDLIYTFSDGVDDDGNGFIDDIAGWDFFERDNDAFSTNEEAFGDHGSGVAKDAAGEGGDGGGIGVCPNCAVLPIRVGDSFITTGAIMTEAVVFAITHHAAAMTMATGGMTNPGLLREAMDLAWEQDLLIVAAAGDETSFHRNFPALNEHALYVHSISSDQEEWEQGTTFMRFVNCNNFGGRMELVAVTDNSCATGAVATISGAAALLRGLGRDLLEPDLRAAEIYQLLNATADDVDVMQSRGADADPDLFPSHPGWDPFFGYGRVDVGRAAEAVAQGDVPPIADIESPRWFDYVDRRHYVAQPGEGVPALAITGSISADRSTGYSWVLDWSWSDEQKEGEWRTFASGEGSAAVHGELARLPIGTILEEAVPAGCGGDAPAQGVAQDAFTDTGYRTDYTCPPLVDGDGIVGRANKLEPYALSIRLTVTDAEGRVGRHRKQIYVRDDNHLLAGWPIHMASSIESSPALADFDGDGVFEVVIAESGGRIHVLRGDGTDLPGWPQEVGLYPEVDASDGGNHLAAPPYAAGHLDPTTLRQQTIASVAVADLDGDGGPPDVVVGTLSGFLFAWRADGTLRPSFPVSMDFDACAPAIRDDDHRWDCGFFASPALVDLDGDGILEILQPGMDQQLYVWEPDGSMRPGFPVVVQDWDDPELANKGARITSSPSVADLDGDGDMEIVVGTAQTAGSDFGGYGLLYALDDTGALLPGWPVDIFAGFAGALPYIGEGVMSSPALGDMDGDGDLEISAAAIASPGKLFSHDGSIAAEFRPSVGDFGAQSNTSEPSALFMVSNSIFADGDGDGVLDVFSSGSGIGYGGNVLAWRDRYEHDHLMLGYSGVTTEENGRHRATHLPGFPRQMEDMQFYTSPVAVDMDGLPGAEVIHGSTLLLRAFRSDGTEAGQGFPFFHGGWQLGSPAVGDIDGDGYHDVVVGTREGWLFAWRTETPASTTPQWPMFKHDAARTGSFHTPLPTQSGPMPPEGGGSCVVQGGGDGSGPGSVALLLAGSVLAAGRRRRRVRQ